MGMAGPIEDAAQRYIDAASFDDETTGHFFGSPAGKAVGKLEIQQNAHLLDVKKQNAGFATIIQLSEGVGYPGSA